jgi:hypothetical protein
MNGISNGRKPRRKSKLTTMNTEKEIPGEILDWIRSHTDNITLGLIAQSAWAKGAENMYLRDQAEIAALKAERDAYRKALEDIVEAFPWSWQAGRAQNALDLYPSPKE